MQAGARAALSALLVAGLGVSAAPGGELAATGGVLGAEGAAARGGVPSTAPDGKKKPRVIVMTDGEIDDRSSMIRFLLYTCDVEVLAIIETNSMFQKTGHSDKDWHEKQLEAYEQIHPNLTKHHPDYPTAERLRGISFVGDEDYEHLKGLRDLRWDLVPGYKTTFRPDDWPDTPGSNRIVEVLLEDNPDPVHLQAWGGGNTAARAFHKLKTEHAADYVRAVSKVKMYNFWYQDGAGNYIESAHPDVTMIYCASFAGTWNYNSQKNTEAFIDNSVKRGHGPLGALYPQTYVSEGDSPAFFYSGDVPLVVEIERRRVECYATASSRSTAGCSSRCLSAAASLGISA